MGVEKKSLQVLFAQWVSANTPPGTRIEFGGSRTPPELELRCSGSSLSQGYFCVRNPGHNRMCLYSEGYEWPCEFTPDPDSVPHRGEDGLTHILTPEPSEILCQDGRYPLGQVRLSKPDLSRCSVPVGLSCPRCRYLAEIEEKP